MMDYKVNCYTFHKGDIVTGVKLSRNRSGKWGVSMGQDGRLFVRLGDENGENRPRVRDRKIMRAGPFVAQAGYKKLVLPADDWRGLLLRVLVRDLDFNKVAPIAKNINLNPGGEGVPPFAQAGDHRDRYSKEQLFFLEEGERIFVIDQKMAVLTITCRAGIPVTRKAEVAEVVQHVIAYGLSSNQYSSVAWAFHTAEALGANGHPGLKKRMAQLNPLP